MLSAPPKKDRARNPRSVFETTALRLLADWQAAGDARFSGRVKANDTDLIRAVHVLSRGAEGHWGRGVNEGRVNTVYRAAAGFCKRVAALGTARENRINNADSSQATAATV